MSDAEDFDAGDGGFDMDALLAQLNDAASERWHGTIIAQHEMAQAFLGALGGGGSPIEPQENGYEFARTYGIKLDGQNIAEGLDGPYKHLKPVYEDEHPFQNTMASAQSGKTGRLLVHLLRNACGAAYGRLIGYYFPDKHLPLAFSRSRLKPMIRSNPALARLLGAPSAAGTKGTDAILTMTLGETTIFLMTIGGKTATEGLPLKAVYFDEVRGMDLGDIERAQKRYSAQVGPIDVKVSTPKYPKGDIHHFFLQGDQRWFHTACGCADGVVMTNAFPDCIADLRQATPQLKRKVEHAYSHAGLPYLGMSEAERDIYPEAAYLCPTCGEILVDPREGWWEQHAPRNRLIHSYQLPKMLSPVSPAGRLLHVYENSTDLQEFHNSELGMPWVDVNKMPLQPEHVDACVNNDLRWGEHLADDVRRRRMVNCAMGLDVQAGYGICVIKVRAPNGKQRTVHLEVVRDPGKEGKSWWHRVGQLMRRYDVSLAVVDEAPEYTNSLNFAKAFPGRVFLANYQLADSSPRFVAWDDQQLADDAKQKGDATLRHRVSMHKQRALDWSLKRWKNRVNEIPNLQTLVQTLPLQNGEPVFSAHLMVGTEGPAALGFILRDHLCRFVFVDAMADVAVIGSKAAERNARQGKMKIIAEHIGGSPDFAHADLYASVALDRIGAPAGVGRL